MSHVSTVLNGAPLRVVVLIERPRREPKGDRDTHLRFNSRRCLNFWIWMITPPRESEIVDMRRWCFTVYGTVSRLAPPLALVGNHLPLPSPPPPRSLTCFSLIKQVMTKRNKCGFCYPIISPSYCFCRCSCSSPNQDTVFPPFFG